MESELVLNFMSMDRSVGSPTSLGFLSEELFGHFFFSASYAFS